MATIYRVVLATVILPATTAFAYSNTDPHHRFAWGENIGWTNWYEANDGADGVGFEEAFLAGYIWAENVGWINVGDGTPADGVHYANLDHTDFGVNVDANGDLFGLAWGENIGWMNFDTRDKGQQRARIDDIEWRYRGYVWGENMGWINLDDAVHYVGLWPCPGDLDGNGFRNVTDFTLFAHAYVSQAGDPNYDPLADLDGDGFVNITDFSLFAAVYGEPCP